MECFYEGAIIYPIYRLGFVGKVIYYMEINDGEMLSVSDEKMVEIEELARNTSLDIERELQESDSSEYAPPNSDYVFVGWENLPTNIIQGPYVIRAMYSKIP